MSSRYRAVLGLMLVPAIGALSAQVRPRPGQYEVTLEMKMPVPGDAQKAVLDAAGFDKKNTRLECIKAEDLEGPNGLVSRLVREAENENCKVSDVKTAGSKTTFTTTCVEDDIRMTSNTEVTFTAESIATFTTAKDNKGNVTTVKTSAKRVGDCPK